MRGGQQLSAEADSEHRHPGLVGIAKQLEFRQQPAVQGLVVGRPGRAEDDDHIEVAGIGKLGLDRRGVVSLLGHDLVGLDGVPELGEPFAHEARMAQMIMLDEQGPHSPAL